MNNEILESSNEIKNAVSLIKDGILHSQQRVLAAINQEQLALYHAIGRFISMNTRKKKWGQVSSRPSALNYVKSYPASEVSPHQALNGVNKRYTNRFGQGL